MLRERGGSLDAQQLHAVMLLAGRPKREAAMAAARRSLERSG